MKQFLFTIVVMLVALGAQAQVNKVEPNGEPVFSPEIQLAIDQLVASGRQFSPEYLDFINGGGDGGVTTNLEQGCTDWQTLQTTRFCGDNICMHQCRTCYLSGPNLENTQECRTIKVFLE